MAIEKKIFGRLSTGEQVSLYTLENKNGMKAIFTDYGAVLVSLFVPDAKGNVKDVVLGFDKLEGYYGNPAGHGSFIGRHANRIGGASFIINGKTFELDKNNGNNNLHGGFTGYNKLMYEVETYEEGDNAAIVFSRLSPDMEQGFPGNLDVSVTYSLTDENELVIEYQAVSDKDTLVNLTNHSYFNLSGHDSGTVLNHMAMINADQFTPTTDDLIPTGEFTHVEGTPMDFRTLKPIGKDFNADYKALKQAGGYDHNYVLNTSGTQVEKAAELVDEKSGRVMEVFTDMPGIQFYTANFLEEEPMCKDGAKYQKQSGVCFETQYYPNSCNLSQFPSCELKAGQEYDHVTVYKFSNR